MPPIVAAAGIGAAASVAGSWMSGRANRDAARMEERSTNAALADAREERTYGRMTDEEQRRYDRMTSEEQRAYDRSRYADETRFERGRYAEERDFGRGQFANYLQRLEPYSQAGVGAVRQLAGSVGRAVPATVPTMGSGTLVTVQAPNGQTQQVPEAHVQHYISKGGKVIG